MEESWKNRIKTVDLTDNQSVAENQPPEHANSGSVPVGAAGSDATASFADSVVGSITPGISRSIDAIEKENAELRAVLDCVIQEIKSRNGKVPDLEAIKKKSILEAVVERACRCGVPIIRSCRMLNIPKSTYYRHRKGPGKRELQRRELAERIIVVQDVNMGRMGIMRMTAALRLDGFERHPGHNQVAAVMREFGLHAVIRRKNNYRVCVKKGVLPDGTVLENKLNREFQQTEPGTHFVTDVTYVPTIEGWLYVSPIIDLCTREVVECKMGIRQDLELALATLSGMKPYSGENIILHSDQGALYTSPGYRKLASELGITLSYSRKGTCWDNAVMEGWNGTLKSEWMYHPAYMRHRHLVPAAQAAREVLEYVQYYNEVRIQKGLGYKSPKQYRKSVE